jgi:thermitase
MVTASATVKTAAQNFQNNGGVVAVSAGNYSTTTTSPDNPYVLTVSATESTDLLASFSNRGTDIDLAAPGQGIWTTIRGGGYSSSSGTSYSAPVVAAAAAMVLSVRPGLNGSQVQSILKNAADDLGVAGWDPSYGYGRLNLDRSLTMALAYAADTSAPNVSFSQPTGTMTLQGPFTVSAQAFDNVGVSSLSVSIDGVMYASSSNGQCSYSWNTANASNGNHQLTAVARDAVGNQSTTTVTVSVDNPVDVTPPVVSITSPANGASIGNSFTVTASASDNLGVRKVELWVDGRLSATDTAAAWGFSVNSRKWTAGTHSLVCKAYDAAGNSAASAAVTVSK